MPEPAAEVAIGAKGLDYGQGLIFIDDDAPCYVHVTGKDAPPKPMPLPRGSGRQSDLSTTWQILGVLGLREHADSTRNQRVH